MSNRRRPETSDKPQTRKAKGTAGVFPGASCVITSELTDRLGRAPNVRPARLARARNLVQDPAYPSSSVIHSIAEKIGSALTGQDSKDP